MAATLPAFPAGRVALIIGNANYKNLTPLSNPGRDASRMAEILAANGFDVMGCGGTEAVCIDLDRGAMLDALENFRDRTEGADIALVFYAGHGMQTAEGNVLAPTDIEISCDDWRARRAILLDDVLEAMNGAKDKIVVLDACRNDPMKAQQCLARGARPLSFGSIAVPGSTSRFLLVTSTQNGQLAQDGRAGGHSPFAEALFHYMDDEPGQRFDQLFDLVTKRVVERTSAANFTQIPEILIRGGAPEACLARGGCSGPGEATSLRAEIAELKASNARNQDYEAIVVALLENAGYGDLDTLPEEERRRFFSDIMAASRAIADKGDKGAVALAALRTGDPLPAETLLEREYAEAKDMAGAAGKRAAATARHIAALARPRDTAKAVSYLAKSVELDPTNVQTWIDLAETSRTLGELKQAARAYQKAIALAAKGLATPEERVWSSEGYADILWDSGKPAEAKPLYQKAAAAARAALKADPGNFGLRRALVVTHYNLGHLALDAGHPDAALVDFDAGLKLAEALVADDASNLAWRFDVGRAWERIGRARQAMGELDLATDAYEKKYAIAQALVAADPANRLWIKDLSLADEFLGDVAIAVGDDEAALARYNSSLGRMVPLAQGDPSNGAYQRFTSVTHLKAGDVLEKQGKLDEARIHFRAGMEASEKLIEIEPDNGTWRWDLFRAYQRMASSTPPGTEYHARALAVIEKMDADGILDPENWRWIGITRERLEAGK